MANSTKQALITRAQTIKNETVSGANTAARVGGAIEDTIDSALFDVYVDNYGAAGDGVTDDTTAIQSALNEGNGATVSVVFTAGKTYLISSQLLIYPNTTIIGHGATLKRANSQTTTLSDIASPGDPTIDVADASIFSVGDSFIIIDDGSPDSGTSYADASTQVPHDITAIDGNTITLKADYPVGSPISGRITDFPIGSTVLRVYAMFSAQENVGIYGLTIDGNRTNNNVNYGWAHTETARVGASDFKVSQCTFKNIPNENLYIQNDTYISNNIFRDCGGSAIHVSAPSAENSGLIVVDGNIFENTNINTIALASHSEAVITNSSKTRKIVVSNNVCKNTGRYFYGTLGGSPGSEHQYVLITGNYAEGLDKFVDAMTVAGVYANDVIINDNVCVDCGKIDFRITTADIVKAEGFGSLQICNNNLKNTVISVSHAKNINISGNNIISDDSTRDLITLNECGQYTVRGNKLVNEYITPGSGVIVGATGFSAQRIKTDASTSTDYVYYNRNSIISDNVIINVLKGIEDGTGNQINNSYIGFKMINNVIQMADNVSAEYGIYCHPGTEVFNNTIVCNSNTNYGIVIRPADSSVSSTIQGPFVMWNRIVGGAVSSIQVGRSGATSYSYNAYVTNNFIDSAIEDNSGGNSTVADNVTLPVTESIPLQYVGENPDFY